MQFGERIYQAKAVDRTFGEYAKGRRSTLVVQPTGTGKTVVAAMLAGRMREERGLRTLFLAHREELINQALATFVRCGIDATVEMAGQKAQDMGILFGHSEVVVGSVASMQKGRLAGWDRDHFGLVIIDECHHSLAASYRNILGHFGSAWICGLTATPDRGDRRNLGSIFESKAFDYPLGHAIKGNNGDDPGGWVVPPKVRRCPVQIDLRGIRVAGPDFNAGDVEERIGPLIEQLARATIVEAEDRQTVIFTPDCGSAQAVADVLRQLGAGAEYVAGTGGKFGMPKEERRDILGRYNRGEFQYLVCADLLFEGWDCPQVSAVAIMRPTKIRARYAQMVGRGIRLWPDGGKVDCRVIDFDWQTDDEARDLSLVVDLFDDGECNEDVMDEARAMERAARKQASDAGREHDDIDPQEIIEKAEEVVRVRTRLNIRLTGKEAKYQAIDIDPMGVGKLLDFKFTKKSNMDTRGDNPATPKQLGMLKFLGIERPEGVSKFGAIKLIDKLMKRRESGLAPVRLVRDLLASGVEGEIARGLSESSARIALAEIQTAKALAAPVQRGLFDE